MREDKSEIAREFVFTRRALRHLPSGALMAIFYLFALLIFGCLGAPVLNHTDIFVRGEGFQCYRVPALLVTAKGTILAFAEARNGTTTPETCQSDADETSKSLALRRSTDGGVTWGPLQIVGTTECGGGFECGYETTVQDLSTGIIFVTFGGKPGVQITQSKDEGETWASFRVIPHIASFTSASPGHGIQIDGTLCGGQGDDCPAGRLVLPVECNTNVSHSCALYSDDHGNTWSLSSEAQPYSRENEFVQIPSQNGNAVLYSNQRNFGPTKGVRLVSWSQNGGSNFSDFSQADSLIEPVNSLWTGVVASVNRLSLSPSRIIFSDPDCPTARTNMTIKVSYDEGSSWNASKVLDPGPSAYSDLGRLSDTTACILYERGPSLEVYEQITFVVFDVDWLEKK